MPKQLKTESITQSIETVQQSDIIAPCPACKKGNISFKRSFYGCSEYASGCKQTFPSQMLGKKVTEKQDLCTKKKTSVIKGMKPKAKEKKPFDASLVLKDDGSIGFEFANSITIDRGFTMKEYMPNDSLNESTYCYNLF
ncbi:topoisomerase C-terminal repeat-containing protein [Peribacillus butanolivorans]|uniref:topoisomerase C-terminal repeat-containing protein n=1 Tax=Peribacillus butanolivorans TaxID=421767 RepID=UPI0036D8FA91